MIRIRKTIALAAFSVSLSTAAGAQEQSGMQPVDAQSQSSLQYGASHWRGSRSEQLIDQAVRYYGFRPNRLTQRQADAIRDTWFELFGGPSVRRPLTRQQATAVVYMALVFPYEREGWYNEGRPGGGYGGGRPGGGWDDRPGGGWDNDGPPYRNEACVAMESDAYRLENLVIGRDGGLFVTDPDKGRARTLTRQIQQRAVECRASLVADRAGDVLRLLAEPLPSRSDLEPRINALKQAIQQTGRGRR